MVLLYYDIVLITALRTMDNGRLILFGHCNETVINYYRIIIVSSSFSDWLCADVNSRFLQCTTQFKLTIPYGTRMNGNGHNSLLIPASDGTAICHPKIHVWVKNKNLCIKYTTIVEQRRYHTLVASELVTKIPKYCLHIQDSVPFHHQHHQSVKTHRNQTLLPIIRMQPPSLSLQKHCIRFEC